MDTNKYGADDLCGHDVLKERGAAALLLSPPSLLPHLLSPPNGKQPTISGTSLSLSGPRKWTTFVGFFLSRPYFWIVISEYNVATAGVGLTWDLTCRSSPFTACYKVLCFSCNLSVTSTIQSYQLLCTKLLATIY